jgi:EmrB/QacA subfamily drug resistance transporter
MSENQMDVTPTAVPSSQAARPPGAAGAAPSRNRWAALAVLCVTVLIVNLDNTVLNVALPTLVRDLNASSSDLQWIVDAYIIVFAGLLLTAGSLADRVGRKKTFVAGLVIFAGGSAWAAFSGSVGLLIAARASMGVGGALMVPSTLSIITDMFREPALRQRAIAMWAGTSGLGVALGPIIGGLLLSHFWWGSVFLINVPIAAIGLLAAFPLVPDSKNPAAPAPDLTGAILTIAGIGLILWAIIEGPVRGWSSGLVIGGGVAGLVILGVFAVWERNSSHPMLKLDFFRMRSFSAAIPAVATAMFGLYGALFVLTQFLQFSLGYSALQTGVRLLPAAGTLLLAAPLSAAPVRFLGSKLTMGAGLALIAGGLWQISGATGATTFGGTVLGMVLLGAGAGLTLPTATGSVVGSVPRGDSGVASATSSTAIQLGGAIGVAVVGSLLSTRYQGRMSAALAGQHLSQPIVAAIQSSLGGALTVAAHAPAQTGELLARAARAAFVSGMDLGTLVAAIAALAGCLLALAWLPARPRAASEDDE